MSEATRRRLQSVRRQLPSREELQAMPKLDQFERIDPDNLKPFHFGQLKWAIERDYIPIILHLETEDDHYDFQHTSSHSTMPLEERNELWPMATYLKAAVVDPRPFIDESYNEVEVEDDQVGIRATCSCGWSREGWEDRRTGHRYPYRTCAHIMTVLAAHDPDVMTLYGERESRIANNRQKLDALAQMGIPLKQMIGGSLAQPNGTATTQAD